MTKLVLVILLISGQAYSNLAGINEFMMSDKGAVSPKSFCQSQDVRLVNLCELNKYFDDETVKHNLIQVLNENLNPQIFITNEHLVNLWRRLDFYLLSSPFLGFPDTDEKIILNPILTLMLTTQVAGFHHAHVDTDFKKNNAGWMYYYLTLEQFMNSMYEVESFERENDLKISMKKAIVSLALYSHQAEKHSEFGVWPQFACSVIAGASFGSVESFQQKETQYIQLQNRLLKLCLSKQMNLDGMLFNFEYMKYRVFDVLEKIK